MPRARKLGNQCRPFIYLTLFVEQNNADRKDVEVPVVHGARRKHVRTNASAVGESVAMPNALVPRSVPFRAS